MPARASALSTVLLARGVLIAAIAQALPELKPRFGQNGGEAIEMAPERLKPFIASEYDKWIKIIHESGMRLD